MFQNLQTWHIITIVIIIFAIIGAVFYMRSSKREVSIKIDQHDQEKVLPKLMTTAASLRSKGNLVSSTGSEGVQQKPLRDPFFYEKLGITLCNKEITNPEEFYKKLNEKFPKDNTSEILLFYIFFSPILTEQQKKDLIVSADFEKQLYFAKVNNYFDNLPYLQDDGKTVVCKQHSEQFCNGKETIPIQEYADNFYNLLSNLFDSNKFSEFMRKTLKMQGKRGSRINDDGSSTEEVIPYTEEEIRQILEIQVPEFDKKLQALKTKIESIPFCSLY